MQVLPELKNRDLRWVEWPGAIRKYVLRADGEEVGSLAFDPDDGSRAVGEMNGQRWTFSREDSMHCYVVVRAEGEPEPVATVIPHWQGSGSVRFRTGARYCWNTSHIWSTTWCFRRENEPASVCVTGDPPSRRGSHVKVCPSSTDLPETPVLVLLGWFLDLLLCDRLAKALTC